MLSCPESLDALSIWCNYSTFFCVVDVNENSLRQTEQAKHDVAINDQNQVIMYRHAYVRANI